MTPARLEEIQNRLDRGISSPVGACALLREVQRLSEEVALLKKKNEELQALIGTR